MLWRDGGDTSQAQVGFDQGVCGLSSAWKVIIARAGTGCPAEGCGPEEVAAPVLQLSDLAFRGLLVRVCRLVVQEDLLQKVLVVLCLV